MSFCPNCGTQQNPGANFCGGCGCTKAAQPTTQQQPVPAGPSHMITLYFQEQRKPFNASSASITIDGEWKAATVKKQMVPIQVPAGYHNISLQSQVGIINRTKEIYMQFTRDTTIVVRWSAWHGGLEADVI